jgi:DNA-binding LacI/PurR family transcriptional regulator
MKKQHQPKHFLIRAQLRKEILDGKHKTLSETQLIRRFGVSSATARRVLNDLAIEGMLHRQVGRGSIVCDFTKRRWHEFGALFFSIFDPEAIFIAEIVRGIEDSLRKKGDRLTMFSSYHNQNNNFGNNSLGYLIRNHLLDGVFVLSPFSVESISLLQREGIPCVSIGNVYPQLQVSSIVDDWGKALLTITHKLQAKGIKRVALITLKKLNDGIERGRDLIWKAWQKHVGQKQPDMIYEVKSEIDTGESAMYHFFRMPPSHRPEAIIVSNSKLSREAHKFLERNTRWHPAMIYMTDQCEKHANVLTPDYYGAGRQAVVVMKKLLENPDLKARTYFKPLKMKIDL